MENVTILWSLGAGIAIAMAGVCALILFERRSLGTLMLCVLGIATAVTAYIELGMFNSATPEEFGEWQQWYHLPLFFAFVSLALFVRTYLKAGRAWLLWTFIAARSVVLVLNFSVEPNFHFYSIESLRQMPLFGGHVSAIGVATTRGWQWFALATMILFATYLIDAAVQAWLKGGAGAKRKALVIALAVVAPFVGTLIYTALLVFGVIQAPLSNVWLLGALVMMGFELGRNFVLSGRARLELSEKLRLILNSADEGIYGIDSEGRCTFCNQACLHMLGYESDEALIGQDMHQLAHHTRADGTQLPVAESRVREVVRTGVGCSITDKVVWRADGTSISADLWCSPQWRGSKVVGAVVGFVDITQRKQAETKAAQLQEDLAHMSRVGMLSALSAALAHEINQPLAAVNLNAEAALVLSSKQPFSTNELRDALHAIQDDSRRAGDVLQRARTLLKKDATRFEEVELNATVSAVVRLVEGSASSRGIVIDTELAAEMPAVWGDRVQIQQVVLNLLMNACDAVEENEKSSRRVNLKIVARDGCAAVDVKDRGSASSDEHVARIFEPFYSTKPDGMGLGLSICRAIVAAHGGTLDATRNADVGITFSATFPFRRAAAMSHEGTIDRRLSGAAS